MVRPSRIEFPGAVYHITTSGNKKVEEAVQKYGYFLLMLEAGVLGR
jgi:hypothetical protein